MRTASIRSVGMFGRSHLGDGGAVEAARAESDRTGRHDAERRAAGESGEVLAGVRAWRTKHPVGNGLTPQTKVEQLRAVASSVDADLRVVGQPSDQFH